MNLIFCQGPLFYSSCHGGERGLRSKPEKGSDIPPRQKKEKEKKKREREKRPKRGEEKENTRQDNMTVVVPFFLKQSISYGLFYPTKREIKYHGENIDCHRTNHGKNRHF
jgi:hypothetical protein